MEIAGRKEFAFAIGQPALARLSLTLRAVAITAELKEMAWWPQRVQRSTWPPKAAVRQRVMARITLSC